MNGYTYYLAIGLDDELFSELNRKFKAAGASEYIQSLKEMYVDFMGMYWLNWNKLSCIHILGCSERISCVHCGSFRWVFICVWH